MCVLRWCPPVRLLCLMLHPVRWLPRRRLVLILALLNRQRQPGRSMSLVVSRHREAEIPLALMMPPNSVWPEFQHGPGSEARLTVTACASICCVCTCIKLCV